MLTQAAIVNCTDCSADTSCYRCLRDFNNQAFHSLLQRGPVLRFLEALQADLTPLEQSLPGSGRVVAANLPLWLFRQLEEAKTSVSICVGQVTASSPEGTSHTWLDVLQELLHRGVKVALAVTQLPDTTPNGLSFLDLGQITVQSTFWSTKRTPL